MQAQQFSLLIEQSGATDLPAGLTPEKFGALAQHPDGLLEVLPWLCRQATGSVPAAQGAGVVVQFRGGPMPLAWTSPWVRMLDDQQCQHRDGPGLRALLTQQVVTCGRADLRARWPALAEAVTDARIRAVHAEPLPVNHQPVGVLTLYSTTHTTVDPVPERLTAVKALLIAALNGYCAAHPHEDHTIRLHRALQDRQLLERAIGILMTRHQVSEDLAREMLTQHSADEHVRPGTAARAVIRQHLSAGGSSQ
jgi:hypothetical protein